MKKIRIFFRSIRDAIRSITRNFSLSMASVLCITITLIIVSVALILAANIQNASKIIKDSLSINVYLVSDATKEDAENLEAEIREIGGIESITYETKDERKLSMASYSDTFKTILNYLDDNPLLDCLVVQVKDVRDINKIAEKILDMQNVETASYGEGMVDEIISGLDIVENITIGVVIALILVTFFLIGNTIKLTIYSRRNEIEIMRLVGASNSAIKLPFLFEGLILGFIGSIIPICITIYGYVILFNTMKGHLFSEMLPLVSPYNFVFYVSVGLLILGELVGSFGSLKAVRKYLKI